MPPEPAPLVAVENLIKHFPIMRGVFRRRVGSVQAVDGLDFAIYPRETLGLVGESGCGKSTVGRVILRLYPPTAGRVTFRGEDITALQGEALRKLRPHMQMIFQDPQDSLNPRMTVGSIVGDVLALREREFVTAARSIGTRRRRIITRHILPNVLSPIMVSATLGIANAIIIESALSFLGLGFPPDFPTWGRLLFDGANFISVTPARVLWPGLAISLTVLSVNYIGDGLRDALDPRLRGA